MNTKQKEYFNSFVIENECTLPVKDWTDFKGLHTHQVEKLLIELLKLN